jgi:hypothetical protein
MIRESIGYCRRSTTAAKWLTFRDRHYVHGAENPVGRAMLFSSLLLSTDSFIVSLAFSTGVSRRHILPLIAMFALWDGFGSAIGPALGIQLPLAGLLSPIFLMLWGGLMILSFSVVENWPQSPVWAYLLPPLLAVDNMLLPGSEPAAIAGLSSGVMAGLGFACGAMTLSRRRTVLPVGRQFIGISLLVAGCLLAMGV